MSIAIKLTGLAHHKIGAISDYIVPKNSCEIRREPNEKGSDGIAYACYCKGLLIGYVPELDTLRKYYAEETGEDKRHQISVWGHAVKMCREQFKIDYDNNGTESWKAVVCGLLYSKVELGQELWIEFDDYSALCQEGRGGGWTLRQISVMVEGCESF